MTRAPRVGCSEQPMVRNFDFSDVHTGSAEDGEQAACGQHHQDVGKIVVRDLLHDVESSGLIIPLEQVVRMRSSL